MKGKFFESVFEFSYESIISVEDFVLCLGVALALGVMIALAYAFKSRFTRSFLFTLGILPAVVSVVIMMVNGQVGAGIAVAGAFSLVRFRSAPGSAKEIAAIFLAMSAGLACGMGYLGFAAMFSVIVAILLALFNLVSSLTENRPTLRKTVNTVIITKTYILKVVSFSKVHMWRNTLRITYYFIKVTCVCST